MLPKLLPLVTFQLNYLPVYAKVQVTLVVFSIFMQSEYLVIKYHTESIYFYSLAVKNIRLIFHGIVSFLDSFDDYSRYCNIRVMSVIYIIRLIWNCYSQKCFISVQSVVICIIFCEFRWKILWTSFILSFSASDVRAPGQCQGSRYRRSLRNS